MQNYEIGTCSTPPYTSHAHLSNPHDVVYIEAVIWHSALQPISQSEVWLGLSHLHQPGAQYLKIASKT